MEKLALSMAVLISSALWPGGAEAAFSISFLDSAQLDFGMMAAGEAKELNPGGYRDEVITTSDGGVPYFLKIYYTTPLTSSSSTLPDSSLQWQSIYNDGQGNLETSGYQPFSTNPQRVYTAAGTDLTGTAVRTRLRYRLTLPANAAAGTYNSSIVYLLTETL